MTVISLLYHVYRLINYIKIANANAIVVDASRTGSVAPDCADPLFILATRFLSIFFSFCIY